MIYNNFGGTKMIRRIFMAIMAIVVASSVVFVATAAEAKPKPKPKVTISKYTSKTHLGNNSTFKGKVNTKKAVGAKVAVQRKTSKGWKNVKTGKIAKNRTYKLKFKVTVKKSKYRVRVYANKKIRAATSRKVTVKATAGSKNTYKPIPTKPSAVEARILKDTNAERAKLGLPPLTIDKRLTAAAQKWANKMSTVGCEHSSFDYRKANALPLPYTLPAENLACGYDPDKAVGAWMKSPGHRSQIVVPYYSIMGVGYNAKKGYTVAWYSGIYEY